MRETGRFSCDDPRQSYRPKAGGLPVQRASALAVSALLLISSACQGAASPPAAPTAASAPTAAAKAAAPAGSTPLATLYAAAKTEGQITRWGSEDPKSMAQIEQAFMAKYPGITVTDVTVNPNDVPQRLLAEKAAGQAAPDVFSGQTEFNGPLRDAGALDADPGWGALGVNPDLVGNDGGLIVLYSPYVIAYNKDLVKAADLPTTWQQLADPKWAGKLSVDPRGIPFNLLEPKLGRDGLIKLVTDIQKNVKPQVVQGSTAGLVGIGSGEAQLRPSILHDAQTQVATGAPIAYTVLDIVPVQLSLWYVPKAAPHPNAAKLFAIWFATEGQSLNQSLMGRTNVRPPDVPASAVLVPSPSDQVSIAAVTPQIATIWRGN